jgi:hypothetical protein
VTPSITPTISVTPSSTCSPYVTPTSTPVPSQTPSVTPPNSPSPTPTLSPTPTPSCVKPGGLSTKKIWVSYQTARGNINYISNFGYNYACTQYNNLYINGGAAATSSIDVQASSWSVGQKVYLSGSSGCSGVNAGSYWLTNTSTNASSLAASGSVDIATINSSGFITDITNCAVN